MEKNSLKKKGLVAILSSERNSFSTQFIQSLIRLQNFMGAAIEIEFVHSGTIPDGRNLALKLAKDRDCDYLLFIDSDMTFPSFGIEVLMDSMTRMGAFIGCGIYFGTYPPFESKPMAYEERFEQDAEGNFTISLQVPLEDWKATRYVTSCGMGFTLIDKALFDIKFEFRPLLGEDHLFCKEAAKLGHKIILEPGVKCGHLRTIALDEELVARLFRK